MPYSCTAQPERLPIVTGDSVLVVNRGDDVILLGHDSSTIRTYGTPIPPGANVLMDLSKPRYICACSGTQTYDLLQGGQSSTPSSTEIATQLIDSGLAGDIGSSVAQEIINTNLSGQIATSLLLTGTRIVDKPITTPFGPLDHWGYNNIGVPIQDLTDAQTVTISWEWEVLTAQNLSPFGELTVAWWSDIYGTVSFGEEYFEMAAPDINNPGTVGITPRGVITLPVKAPGMSLSFNGRSDPPGGLGNVRASGSILKSYRVTNRTQWQTDAAGDHILGFASAVGVPNTGSQLSSAIAFAPFDGAVEFHAWCSSTGTVNSHVRLGWGSESWARPISGSNPTMEDVIFFPNNAFGAWTSRQFGGGSRRPMYVRFFNGESGARNFTAWITVNS